MSTGLTRIGVNDVGLSREVLGDALYKANFVPGRTVKVATQNGQCLDNDRVGVAFDSVEWLNPRKKATP
jgi:hypothetical protein